MNIGLQAGIKLSASCSPFDAIPPPLWQAFKLAVLESAKNWGLSVHISEGPSISAAEQNFWKLHREHENARLEAEPGE